MQRIFTWKRPEILQTTRDRVVQINLAIFISNHIHTQIENRYIDPRFETCINEKVGALGLFGEMKLIGHVYM